jgi:diguanylate cyclase (GGDEF)-like protein
MLPPPGSHARRFRSVALATVALAVVLGALGLFVAGSQHESRSRLVANFKLRGSASATLVSTYIAQQAVRQRHSAEQLMSVPTVTRSRFRTVATAFGAQGAVLVDSRGAILNVTPSSAGRIGQSLMSYETTRDALHNRTAVSDVLPGPNGLQSIVSIAVPFQTGLVGRRVFAAAYTVDGPQLEAFVDHAIAYPQHEVLLIDRRGRLLSASPRTPASSIWGANLPLARALAAGGTTGSVQGAKAPSTFTVAPISGTPWRMVLMVPNSKLFASISGSAQFTPWLVLGLVTVLGVLLLLLFARLLSDRSRLSLLSSELESIARTDPLTGLSNRRGIDEGLARAFARTRRRGEPMTALMIDLDRFKAVNDRYGHEAGDRVLVAVAECMRDALRVEDIYGRIGGDEFVVVMAGTDEIAGRAAAGRLEKRAASVNLSDLGLPNGIPMSIGQASGVHMRPEDLMRAADAELYRVKDAHRAGAQGAPAATSR